MASRAVGARAVGARAAGTLAVGALAVGTLALAACSSPGPTPDGASVTASAPSANGTGAAGSADAASSARPPEPAPTNPFEYGPGGRAALGPGYCVVVARPARPYGLADAVRRLGGDPAAARPYREDADGGPFRSGAEELPSATPGVDDAGRALYRVAEQAGAWTAWQASGRRCIADATLRELTRGGGTAMAYTRDVDDQARLAYARDGVVLVNLDPAILPDDSDRRGAQPGVLDGDPLSGLTIAAQHEGSLDVPAANLIERTLRVRLDDRWLAAPSTLVTADAAVT